MNDAGGRERLFALGVRTVPVVSLGDQYVFARGHKRGSDLSVVIKTVLAERLGASQAAGLLRREHEILSTLDSPSIVKPLVLEDVDGLPAMVLEDAGPENLKEWLRRHPEFRLVTLPAYSPNLNLIERLWKFLRQRALSRWHKTFAEMQAAVALVLDHLADYRAELDTLMTEKFAIIDPEALAERDAVAA